MAFEFQPETVRVLLEKYARALGIVNVADSPRSRDFTARYVGAMQAILRMAYRADQQDTRARVERYLELKMPESEFMELLRELRDLLPAMAELPEQKN
jgi:hypothetical protein